MRQTFYLLVLKPSKIVIITVILGLHYIQFNLLNCDFSNHLQHYS